jgi:hypothetical protein
MISVVRYQLLRPWICRDWPDFRKGVSLTIVYQLQCSSFLSLFCICHTGMCWGCMEYGSCAWKQDTHDNKPSDRKIIYVVSNVHMYTNHGTHSELLQRQQGVHDALVDAYESQTPLGKATVTVGRYKLLRYGFKHARSVSRAKELLVDLRMVFLWWEEDTCRQWYVTADSSHIVALWRIGDAGKYEGRRQERSEREWGW